MDLAEAFPKIYGINHCIYSVFLFVPFSIALHTVSAVFYQIHFKDISLLANM